MALPWFRVYSDLLNSLKFHKLSDTLKARVLLLWCVAAWLLWVADLPCVAAIAAPLPAVSARAAEAARSVLIRLRMDTSFRP